MPANSAGALKDARQAQATAAHRTRYDKLATNFLSLIKLARIMLWLSALRLVGIHRELMVAAARQIMASKLWSVLQARMLSARPATQPGHLGRCPGLVDEQQPFRAFLHPGLAVCRPYPPSLDNVSAIGLARQQRFFLTVNPCRINSRDSDAGCAVTLCSARSLAASSGMVMSPSASTQPISASICRVSRPPPTGRPCFAGAREPVSALRRLSRNAVEGATPNRRAAARHDWPRSTSPIIRTRKSDELLLPMIHLQ